VASINIPAILWATLYEYAPGRFLPRRSKIGEQERIADGSSIDEKGIPQTLSGNYGGNFSSLFS
jgi:hypothetical protein